MNKLDAMNSSSQPVTFSFRLSKMLLKVNNKLLEMRKHTAH